MLKQWFQGKVQVITYLQEHLPEESWSNKSSWQIPANRSRVMKRKLLNTSDAFHLQFQSSKNLGISSWENGYSCSLHCIVWPLLLSFVNGFLGYNIILPFIWIIWIWMPEKQVYPLIINELGHLLQVSQCLLRNLQFCKLTVMCKSCLK